MMHLKGPEVIIPVLSEKLKETIGATLYQDFAEKIQSQDWNGISNFYRKAGRDSDDVLSQISNDVVSQIIEILPQRFAQLTLENISLKTKGNDPKIKFDVGFQMEPIKPYVEFIAKSYGQHLISCRTRFEINSKVTLKETELKFNKDQKRELVLGTLELEMIVSLVGLPFIPIEESKELLSKKITLDLSEYTFAV